MSATAPSINATDSAYAIETPEGVRIHFECAGPFARMAAMLVDTMIQIGISIGGTLLVMLMGMMIGFGVSNGIRLILAFLLFWFYHVFFELYRSGQTPGKKIFNLQVIDVRGTPIAMGKSILRNLLRTADLLPFGYAFGLISMLNTSRFQRLGDLVAGTMVVYVPQAETPYEAPSSIKPMPPPIPLTLEEQRAIIAFGERRGVIPAALSEELAANLKGLTKNEGDSAGETLYAVGAWLAGGRR